MKEFWVYMVECADGTLYTGWSTDVAHRVQMHNAGRGAKYTKTRRPVTVCYTERCVSKSAAMRREAAIKALTRAEKRDLIQHFDAIHVEEHFKKTQKSTAREESKC